MSTLAATNLKHASSASNNIVLDSSGNATFAGTAVPSSSFLRNRIINGGMQIWQRGTSGFTSGYAVDRWYLNGANAASRSTDVPSSFQYSMSFTNSSTTVCGISQRIESVNTIDLASQNVTVSFWFKRTGSVGNLQVNLDYPTAVDNYTTTASIGATQVSASPATSWTYYTVTFTSISANVVNGLLVSIFSVNGSAASLGGLITGVQLEVGSAATPFERRQYGQELALCQRYFQRMENILVFTSAWSATPIMVSLRATMRAVPTVALSALTAGSGGAYGALDENVLYQSVANSSQATGRLTASAEL